MPAKDAALNSYSQLGASRLGAERGIISLFDRTQQHILAEATPTLSLIGGHAAHEEEKLLLGCCVLPKEKGLCHYVTTSQQREFSNEQGYPDDHSIYSLDVSKDPRIKSASLLPALSTVRFFAAVPIISPKGFLIGSFSVMDSKTRTSPPDQHTFQFMKEAAAAVMDYLEMRETAHRSRRAERMIAGLGSFVEGHSTLRDSWWEAKAQQSVAEKSGRSSDGQSNMEQQDLQETEKGKTGNKALAFRLAERDYDAPDSRNSSSSPQQNTRPSSEASSPPKEENGDQSSGPESTQVATCTRSVLAGDRLQDDTFPRSIRDIFSRAANLIRESIGAEGVIFLDADSDSFGRLVESNKRTVSGPGTKDNTTSSSDESTDSGSNGLPSSQRGKDSGSEDGDVKYSECLGISRSKRSDIDDESRTGEAIEVPEPLFTSLIRRYPRGKIFTYNAGGSVSEDSDDPMKGPSGSEHDKASPEVPRSGSKRRRKPFRQHAESLIKIFSGARNILVLPIWDPDRSRWFAGALAWTNQPDRIFTFENELIFISAFTNSIMTEVRRVDVKIAEKAKTNLVSSITHELRNPLHGILGTADILSDTAMNALQHGMVHTIESCGRTLLDTINNLLDLTFIDQYRKERHSKGKGHDKKKASIPKGLPGGDTSSFTRVQLDSVLEEVTECVFSGYCFYNHPQAPPPALAESSSRSAGQPSKADPVGPKANQVTVIFDIDPNTEWDFYTHPGAWRRILMNLFGNAVKYTSSGYIYLGLKSSHRGDQEPSSKGHRKRQDEFNVTITVKDTGKGISPSYLQEDLFTPFMQEDSLASGSGLGLSIVRQAIGFLGGSIDIESTKGVGTTFSIHTPLLKSSAVLEDTSSAGSVFSSLKRHTEDKNIAFLGFGTALRSERDTGLYNSLDRMCREWFGLNVTNLSPLEGKHAPYDFYLAIQTELDCEDTGGRNIFALPEHQENGDSCKSPVVVICQSPEEAHHMFVVSKNRGYATSFEFVSQPCGPRKLARALDMCIKRRIEEEAGRSPSDEPTRWVELPESSHLPVDVGPTDPPEDRMKISKRPTRETIGQDTQVSRSVSPKERHSEPDSKEEKEQAPGEHSHVYGATEKQPPQKRDSDSKPHKGHALLVDDNDLNLQLLCAFAQKEGFEYASGQNGAEAVDLYKADPGKFEVVVIGMLFLRRKL